ncbi:N-acetyl-alpha-D-glucosaminyl L-malate synthase BshA [Sporosarcina sp. P26b]|uniref:N-acetyl-alpha-D-glucosaminyl L-malate synthase BshA n=1 Tax=Sporosarcina TaxID=1569 RepID=UPI000A17DF94|nr:MULTISPECIES: N-acetyl-alpha-D-glucosaminyl L-malate synthase BshA [Sporosarcina]ARK22896.1 N-acetyl-alpha-D-glucosaminyl L-malate synthase BshA [Sporosarcina ureae]PIC95885.1 N-acetyl-alpha-D-glucosaminyl L-malate synthase BshA [Sporosarcina sp. P26b]
MQHRKLKVGVICYPSLGGSGVVATELGLKMASKGHEMHYITSSKPFRFLDVHPNIQFHEVTIEGYAVFKYPPYDIALANRIAQVIESEQLDLLHVHYAVPHAISAILAKDMAESSIGIITTLHGTDVTILGHDPALRNTLSYGINKSDRVTAVSRSLRNETIELLQPKTEIRTIYNFIDEGKYYPREVAHLREELGIAEDEKVLIHISNFRKVKRIPDIIESFRLIDKQHKAKLLLVGEGPEKFDLEEYVERIGLQDDILFLGKRDDLPELLSISDVMLLLSEKEAFGLVLLEAFACGVPAVANAIGGIPEVVQDGVNGFLVQLGDVQAVADRVTQLLSDSALYQQMKKHAIQTVQEEFSSDSIVEQYEELYYEVAAMK